MLIAMNKLYFLKLLFAIYCLASLFACGNTDISGHVFLTSDAGDIKPIAGTEVILLRAESAGAIKDIAEKMTQWVDERSKINIVNILRAEEGLLLKQLDSFGGTRSDTNASDQSVDKQTLKDKLIKLRASEKMADERISDLSGILQSKMDSHEKLLTRSYMDKYVSYKSEMVKDSMRAFDTLCIDVKNEGNLNVTDGTVHIEYNNKPLNSAVVKSYWEPQEDRYSSYGNRVIFFPKIDFLRQNKYKENIYGLAPGDNNSYCLKWNAFPYLAGHTQRDAEQVGLNEKSTSRSGQWEIKLQSISLSSGERVQKKIGWLDSHVFDSTLPVFDEELLLAAKSWPERAELIRLSKELSGIKKQVALTEKQLKTTASLEAHASKRGDVQNALVSIQQKIKSVEDGAKKASEFLKAELNRILKSQAYRDKSNSLVGEVLSDQRISSTHTSIDGSYHFLAVPKGEYLIYTRYEILGDLKAVWLKEVEANGTVKADLSNYNMNPGIEEFFSSSISN